MIWSRLFDLLYLLSIRDRHIGTIFLPSITMSFIGEVIVNHDMFFEVKKDKKGHILEKLHSMLKLWHKVLEFLDGYVVETWISDDVSIFYDLYNTNLTSIAIPM